MRTALLCISILLLIAGCDSIDKTGSADPSPRTEQATAESRDAGLPVVENPSVMPGEQTTQTKPASLNAKVSTLSKELTEAVQQPETIIRTDLAVGNASVETDSKIKSSLDTKTFKRFTPDQEEIARKTAAHADEKGPALTAPVRRISQPASD